MINIYNTKNDNLIKAVIIKSLLYFNIPHNDIELEVNILSDKKMKALNLEKRNIDSVTDVLSFPAIDVMFPFSKDDYKNDINPENGCVILGDIFISDNKAKKQAEEYNHSFSRELAFLTCHACLHLLGYGHMEEEKEKEMQEITDKILKEMKLTRDVDDEAAEKIALYYLSKIDADKPINNPDKENFKSGFVAVLGRPNAGKSTLINSLVGQKVAIVSYKPQTTRNRILGISTKDNSQIIFIDTPGIHTPKNELGKFMMNSVSASIDGIDVLVYLIDGEKGFLKQDREALNKYNNGAYKIIIAVNKVDHITKARVGEIFEQLRLIENIEAIVPISAIKGTNVELLRKEILKLLKDTTQYYDDDSYTDKSMRFVASEIIREKALRLLSDELPYGIGVFINKYELRQEKPIIDIDADIFL